MAFVYRSQQPNRNISSSPNTYLAPHHYQLHPNKAPFLSTSLRFQPPPPPQHSNDIIQFHQMQNPGKGSGCFISKTKRLVFQNRKQTPDPGQQQQIIISQHKKIQKRKQQQGIPYKNFIKILLENISYKAVPSIPHKQNKYGYSISNKNILVKNKVPNQNYSGEIGDSVGPGTYQLIKNHHTHNTNLNKPTGERFKKQSSTNLGPGRYQINQIPRYEMPHSACFLSRSQKVFDQRGQIINKSNNNKRKVYKNKILLQSQKIKTQSSQYSNSQQEQQFSTIPGPGTYINRQQQQNQVQKIKIKRMRLEQKKKNKFFGSTKRFPNQKLKHTIDWLKIGQKYNPKLKFGKNKRFSASKKQQIGPGFYNQEDFMMKDLNKKFMKGYCGKFASTANRFKYPKNNNIPYYISNENLPKSGSPTGNFSSKTIRNAFNITSIVYLLANCNIAFYDNNMKVAQQQDYVKAPFNTSNPRFKIEQVEQKITEEQLIKLKQASQQQRSGGNNMFECVKKKKKKSFIKQEQIHPGPGVNYSYQQYEISQSWQKPTFNLLYTQIK